MIDLSFLTQEESEKIMAVLKRDAELKKAEEKRIQNLQRTVADKSQLKCLTGEWFYESKQLRHQECIHGSDIIRASIRRKSIPLTKVEVSHTLTKKSSFGTNERKGASEPSSPCRLREEPNIAGYQNRDLQETSSNAAEVVLQARPKWRQNPFNSEHTEAINSQQLDGEMDLTLSENKTVSEQYYPEPLITAESGLVLAAHKRGSIEKSDEVKRSPLKTLHPRVLPKETPKEPNPESNPFRTFPIDLNVKPQTTAELESKPSAAMRPRTGSSQTIMASKLNPFEDITPPPLTLEVIDGETCHGQAKQPSISTSTFSSESNKTSEAMAPFTQLARAFIPQDNQHYLGPQEKAHIPSFQAVEHAGEETDAADKMIKAPSASSGNQSDQNSLSYAENIEISAWTKLSSRNLTSSRSLENLTSETTLALSSFSTMKSSVSSLSLQPQKMSSSRSSIYPLDTEVQGSIQFAVNYIQKLEEFQVFVVNCRGLAIAETKKNLSDPYVKCYLAPDKTRLGKKKTTVKKRTLNPTYNEVLKFKIPLEELKKQTLIVSVWHNDLFGRNSFLGDVDLNLSEWDFKNAEINEYKLKAKVSTEVIRGSHFGLQQNGGKMRVALRFIPKKIKSKGISTTEAGELLIWVKDCKDLPQVRRVIINPFVKCTVLPDTSRKSQQKTRVVKRTANPLFNHTMVYDGFQSEDLRQACVEITVWDRDRLHNHFIGGVRLGPGTGKSYGVDVAWMDSTTTEVNLWNKMLHSNGEWVEDVLPLRMLVMANGL